MMRRREKTYCEWCGHEITFRGADVQYCVEDHNDTPHIICAGCFHADDDAVREMMDSITTADVEFYGDYIEDDF